ncbi:hypothetical protein JHK82_031107 [Glycine max]|nr:hypothetical protein JHK85_031754 [Glycine max]KAG5124370.1 hypothetical protein JHK82_031107 [Glycine max]
MPHQWPTFLGPIHCLLKQATSWRPCSSRDIIISVASEMSQESKRNSQLPVQVHSDLQLLFYDKMSMLMKRYIGSVTQSSNETPPTKTIQTSEDMYDLSLSLLPQQLHRLIAVVADGNIKTSLATSSNPDLDASWRQRQLGVHNAHQKGFSEWGPQNDYLRMILQAIIS